MHEQSKSAQAQPKADTPTKSDTAKASKPSIKDAALRYCRAKAALIAAEDEAKQAEASLNEVAAKTEMPITITVDGERFIIGRHRRKLTLSRANEIG